MGAPLLRRPSLTKQGRTSSCKRALDFCFVAQTLAHSMHRLWLMQEARVSSAGHPLFSAVAPAVILRRRQILQEAEHKWDCNEVYAVADATHKTTASGWLWWKMCLAGKRMSSKSSLPVTSLCELGFARIPKEDEPHIAAVVEEILRLYQGHGVDLRSRISRCAWDDLSAGRLACQKSGLVFARDMRHQQEAVKRQKDKCSEKSKRDWISGEVHFSGFMLSWSLPLFSAFWDSVCCRLAQEAGVHVSCAIPETQNPLKRRPRQQRRDVCRKVGVSFKKTVGPTLTSHMFLSTKAGPIHSLLCLAALQVVKLGSIICQKIEGLCSPDREFGQVNTG